MPTPKISVIIPSWNGISYLAVCLDALRAQTFRDFDVWFIDNASTDGSAEFVRQSHPEVNIINMESNVGFGRAVNAGIRASGGELVALLNNDTAADPRWLEEAAAVFERRPDAGLVACRVVFMDRPDILDSAGDVCAAWGAVFNRGHGQPFGQEFATERDIFGVCGSAALVRRTVFDEIGLFDENLFAYYEDLDLNLRARLRGFQCIYAPEAVVRHSYSGSTVGERPKLGREEVYLYLTAVWLKNMPASIMLRHAASAAGFHSLIFLYYLLARARRPGPESCKPPARCRARRRSRWLLVRPTCNRQE